MTVTTETPRPTLTETFAWKVCTNCWGDTRHSIITPSTPTLPSLSECKSCGWVS